MLFTVKLIIGYKLSNNDFKNEKYKKKILINIIIDIVAAILITLGALMVCKYSMFGFSGSIKTGAIIIGLSSAPYLTLYTASLIDDIIRYKNNKKIVKYQP